MATQKELHEWVTGIRIAKNGRHLFDNYRGIVEEITHADIDILTSKRFSINSTTGLKNLTSPAEKTSEVQPQALTPSSENKSLASALSSGIESDMSQSSSKGKTSEESLSMEVEAVVERSSTGVTPVGTLERPGFNLRRSFSRSSRSSSSSGCLSDNGGFGGGFESDFPAGGTIKKRPTATARLPLTTTTWGLVRESDDHPEQENMTLGAGGTLLRKAVKNNLSKKSSVAENESIYGQRSADSVDSGVSGRGFATAPSQDDESSSAFERSISCMSGEEEPLPLPPPPNTSASMTSLDSIDLLPPPPPEMCYGQPTENHYHSSPVTSPLGPPKPLPGEQKSLPPVGPPPSSSNRPKPPTLKKSNSVQKSSSRKISFDDNVQMIDHPASPNPPAIPKYVPAGPIRNENPRKITWADTEAGDSSSLPRSFLENLQKVMNKKWQVAEKCQANVEMTPHKVLGFRTEEPVNKVGQPNMYSKNSAIGAWVLETQMYAHEPPFYQQDSPPQVRQQPSQLNHIQQQQQQMQQQQILLQQQQQHLLNQQQQIQQHKSQPQQSPMLQHHQHKLQIQQQQHQQEHGQQQYGHNGVYGQYEVALASPMGQVQQVPELEDPYGSYYPGQTGPVVLREPEPAYVDPGRMRQNKGKRPPPPPRRSQDTQLTNHVI